MSSSFFEPPPPPPPQPPPPPPPAWMKPRGVLGAVVPVNFVLARTDEAAVCVWGITAYPNGFDFVVASMLRDAGSGRFRHMDFMHMRLAMEGGPVAHEFLRIGVQCADGSKATNLGAAAIPRGEAPGRVLYGRGGGGGGADWSQSYWCWPLPPPGPIAFVCEWPAFGIAHTEHEIDAGPILDAAAKTKRIWDD